MATKVSMATKVPTATNFQRKQKFQRQQIFKLLIGGNVYAVLFAIPVENQQPINQVNGIKLETSKPFFLNLHLLLSCNSLHLQHDSQILQMNIHLRLFDY